MKATTNHDFVLVSQLSCSGEQLAPEVKKRIKERGQLVIPDLIAILEDEALALEGAPGDGWAPIHAATMLGELNAIEAAEPMLRVLSRCDAMEVLYSKVIFVLQSFGPPILEVVLAEYEQMESEDSAYALVDVLAGLGIRDDRIFSILLRTLRLDTAFGAGSLAAYGDPAAIPHLSGALSNCTFDKSGAAFANDDIIDIVAAIEDLGGKLNRKQTQLLKHVHNASALWRKRQFGAARPMT